MIGSSPKVVVVGAGIVGAAVADALAKDGASVTVVDRSIPGGGATAAGMGHIVVMTGSEAQIALTQYSQRLWAELAPSLPAAGERMVCGTIWVAANEEQGRALPKSSEVYQRQGLRAEVLSADDLYRLEPNLRKGLSGGLLVPDDSVVFPPPIAAALLKNVEERGGEIRIGQAVTEMNGQRVRLTDGSVLECDYAINATGAAAATLTADCGVRPRKGHLAITDRYPGFVKHQLVEMGYLQSAHHGTDASVAFNVQPRPNGQVLIGSSREFAQESREINHSILSRMLRRAMSFMPGIEELSVLRTWTGFRAAGPDDLPLIGPHPEDPRLILATGHEGLGITTSIATARLVADFIANREPEIPMEPYLPARLTEGAVAHAK